MFDNFNNSLQLRMYKRIKHNFFIKKTKFFGITTFSILFYLSYDTDKKLK